MIAMVSDDDSGGSWPLLVDPAAKPVSRVSSDSNLRTAYRFLRLQTTERSALAPNTAVTSAN